MSDFTAALAARREQYAHALAQYRLAEPKTKLQLTRWEILRWAVGALNVVLTATKQALVKMEPAPWALTEQEVFEAACDQQRAGLCLLGKSKSYALAA